MPDLRCLAIDGPAFVNVAEFAHLSNLAELAISSRVDEELLQAVMELSQLRVHRLPSICLTAAQFSAVCRRVTPIPEFQELVMDELRLSALLAAQRASSIKRITVRRGLHLTRPPPVQQACAQEHVEQGTVGVRDQALQPTGKPNPQWLPRGLQPPYVPVPFINPQPIHWW